MFECTAIHILSYRTTNDINIGLLGNISMETAAIHGVGNG